MQNTPQAPSGSEMAKAAAKQLKAEMTAKMNAAKAKYGQMAEELKTSSTTGDNINKVKTLATKDNLKGLALTALGGLASVATFANPGNMMDLHKKVGELEAMHKMENVKSDEALDRKNAAIKEVTELANKSGIGQESVGKKINDRKQIEIDAQIKSKEEEISNLQNSHARKLNIVAAQYDLRTLKEDKITTQEGVKDFGNYIDSHQSSRMDYNTNEITDRGPITKSDLRGPNSNGMSDENAQFEKLDEAVGKLSLSKLQLNNAQKERDIETANSPTNQLNDIRAEKQKADDLAKMAGGLGAVAGALGAFKFKNKKGEEFTLKNNSVPEPVPTEPIAEAKIEEPVEIKTPDVNNNINQTEFTAQEYGPQEAPVVVEPAIEKVVESVKPPEVRQSFFQKLGKWATIATGIGGVALGGTKGIEALNGFNKVDISKEGTVLVEKDTSNPRGAPGQYLSGNSSESGADAVKAAAEKAELDEGAAIAREMFSKETLERKNNAETAMNNETSNLYKDNEKTKVAQAENALKDETATMDETINNNTPLHDLKVQTTILNAEKAGLSPEKMVKLKKFLLYNQGPSIGESTKALLTGAPEVKATSIETTTPVVAEKVAEVTPSHDIASEGTPDEAPIATPAPAVEAPKVQEAISPEYAAAKIKVEQASAETGAGAKYVEYTRKVTQELITNMSATLAEKGGTMSPQEVKVLNAKINAAKYLNSHLVDGKMYVTIAESAKATFKEAANGNPNSIFQQAADAKYGNFNLVKFGSYQFESGTMDKSGVQDFLQKYEVISRS